MYYRTGSLRTNTTAQQSSHGHILNFRTQSSSCAASFHTSEIITIGAGTSSYRSNRNGSIKIPLVSSRSIKRTALETVQPEHNFCSKACTEHGTWSMNQLRAPSPVLYARGIHISRLQ